VLFLRWEFVRIFEQMASACSLIQSSTVAMNQSWRTRKEKLTLTRDVVSLSSIALPGSSLYIS
jgi:hypothetical protein